MQKEELGLGLGLGLMLVLVLVLMSVLVLVLDSVIGAGVANQPASSSASALSPIASTPPPLG